MKCWVLIGPTAGGKTEAALALASIAEPLEIISCDSMQVYRGMDIGTAKVSPEHRARVPHHMIDVVDADQDFSVGRYVEMAEAAIAAARSADKRPLIVGGTALYLKALLWGLFEGPPADPEIRRRLRGFADTHGVQALHDRLVKVDPETARRFHPNDVLRILRALEVYELTGQPISTLQQQFTGPPRIDFVLAGLWWPRQVLYERIDRRVDEMFRRGFVEEVRRLIASPGLGPQASQALGYRQVAAYLRGESALEHAMAETRKGTRRFAKHQLTWFKHFPGLKWVRCAEFPSAESAAHRLLHIFGEYT